MEQIIGRREEIQLLQAIKQSNEPELLAIFGRRRMGKTFLVPAKY
jgi:AAA+ ATPase superfamily predicted ATPase